MTALSAALMWNNGRVYYFSGPNYIRYNIAADCADIGYPRTISGNWPGLWRTGIDSAINWGNGKAYFFRGDEYTRYDIAADKADPGYPKPIKGNWRGLWTDRIDAAINWGNGKAYFFRGDEYTRYDIAADKADPGYPKKNHPYWPGLLFQPLSPALGIIAINRSPYDVYARPENKTSEVMIPAHDWKLGLTGFEGVATHNQTKGRMAHCHTGSIILVHEDGSVTCYGKETLTDLPHAYEPEWFNEPPDDGWKPLSDRSKQIAERLKKENEATFGPNREARERRERQEREYQERLERYDRGERDPGEPPRRTDEMHDPF